MIQMSKEDDSNNEQKIDHVLFSFQTDDAVVDSLEPLNTILSDNQMEDNKPHVLLADSDPLAKNDVLNDLLLLNNALDISNESTKSEETAIANDIQVYNNVINEIDYENYIRKIRDELLNYNSTIFQTPVVDDSEKKILSATPLTPDMWAVRKLEEIKGRTTVLTETKQIPRSSKSNHHKKKYASNKSTDEWAMNKLEEIKEIRKKPMKKSHRKTDNIKSYYRDIEVSD
jgi:hypothetical protein